MHLLSSLLLALTVSLVLASSRRCGPLVRGNAHRAVDALERLAEFLSLHKDVATADHALGVAIARGQIQAALRSLRAPAGPGPGPGRPEPEPQHAAGLDALAARLEAVDADLNAVLRDLQASSGPVPLLQPWLWRVERPFVTGRGRRPDGRGAWGRGQPEQVSAGGPPPPAEAVLELRELSAGGGRPTEAESDRCIGALLAPGARCHVPEECARAEVQDAGDAAVGYAATHRVLYHHVARQMGCSRPGSAVGTRDAIERLCDGILLEAEDIARAGFPPLLRDLFAEQMALCGLQGFEAFARASWLDRLLSWQRPAGCFGDLGEQREAAGPFLALRDNARLDDPLGNQCLSHLTGVAAAAVAFSARVLVDGWREGGCSRSPLRSA
ncbi:UPF0764 protein C16orf89-like protein [Frankliniella fusca]|uniref:UPF0764 protein C16orf89-like protein n=1 Tax=Frankliniella fusca TaxID=407009 RepID=A0AAE1I188_9NEOP|nr:UPF0764 protein C16orf89-like protein [Frankliniella fusca]